MNFLKGYSCHFLETKPGIFKIIRVSLEAMSETLQLTHIRVGDIPLLLGLVIKLGIPDIYDREIGDHGSHTGLSGGWMVAIWITFILTECDHTKYKVEEWADRHAGLLSSLTLQEIR